MYVIVAVDSDAHFHVFPYNLENMRALLKDTIKGNQVNTVDIFFEPEEAQKLLDDPETSIDAIRKCLGGCFGRSAGLRLDIIEVSETYTTCGWWE